MKKYFYQDSGISYKGDRTIVTLADKEINHILIEKVKEKLFYDDIRFKNLRINTENIDLLGNAGSATFSIAAMSQWQYIGYTVVLFVVAIQNIPADLYEAADIDGASALKKFFYITLPEIKDTILINMIITITGSIREYDEVFVTTNGGPGYASETLATYLYKVGFRNDQMGYASAIAFFIFIVTFAIGLLQMKGYKLDE